MVAALIMGAAIRPDPVAVKMRPLAPGRRIAVYELQSQRTEQPDVAASDCAVGT
jgi:hypothetical protein